MENRDTAIRFRVHEDRALSVNNERLATITYLALDDLAEGHADLPTILRLAASLGWREGRREAERERAERESAGRRPTPRGPVGRAEDPSGNDGPGRTGQPPLPTPRGSSEQTGLDTELPFLPADHNT